MNITRRVFLSGAAASIAGPKAPFFRATAPAALAAAQPLTTAPSFMPAASWGLRSFLAGQSLEHLMIPIKGSKILPHDLLFSCMRPLMLAHAQMHLAAQSDKEDRNTFFKDLEKSLKSTLESYRSHHTGYGHDPRDIKLLKAALRSLGNPKRRQAGLEKLKKFWESTSKYRQAEHIKPSKSGINFGRAVTLSDRIFDVQDFTYVDNKTLSFEVAYEMWALLHIGCRPNIYKLDADIEAFLDHPIHDIHSSLRKHTLITPIQKSEEQYRFKKNLPPLEAQTLEMAVDRIWNAFKPFYEDKTLDALTYQWSQKGVKTNKLWGLIKDCKTYDSVAGVFVNIANELKAHLCPTLSPIDYYNLKPLFFPESPNAQHTPDRSDSVVGLGELADAVGRLGDNLATGSQHVASTPASAPTSCPETSAQSPAPLAIDYKPSAPMPMPMAETVGKKTPVKTQEHRPTTYTV